MLKTVKQYWQVWLITATNAVQETFVNRWSNSLFIVAKSVRFMMMIAFLLLLKNNIANIAGYTSAQMLAFYVTYQLIDTALQILYRGVYEFGSTIRNGTFDAVLSKPINPLFRVMTGTPDINDAFFLIPSTIISFYLLVASNPGIKLSSVLLYLCLLANSFLIGTALHIFIVSLTLVTVDVDNIIWMYRDFSRLAQFPITLYFEAFRLFLFFIVPVGIMVTIPAQILLGTPATYSVAISFLIGVIFFWLSLRMWHWALKQYSSASS